MKKCRGVMHISDLTQKILELKRSFADLMNGIENLVEAYAINGSVLGAPLAPQEQPSVATDELLGPPGDYSPAGDEDIDFMLKNLEVFDMRFK